METKEEQVKCPNCGNEYKYMRGTVITCTQCGKPWDSEQRQETQETDEEIERRIVEEFNPREITLSDRLLIIEGAKWYRDQITKR